jgi:SAM-dependent methyltransferase
MQLIDREASVERYRGLLQKLGPIPQALAWGPQPGPAVRFSILWQELRHHPEASVLDVGCGFADLCSYLRAQGWRGEYRGVDIVPESIAVARERHPGADIRVRDIVADPPQEPADFVYESGIFNFRLPSGNEKEHAQAMIQTMFRLARKAVVCDFLSTYVDFQRPEGCHWDPDFVLRTARTLTKRIRLHMDYLPYEFAVVLWKDDTLGPNRAFAAYRP